MSDLHAMKIQIIDTFMSNTQEARERKSNTVLSDRLVVRFQCGNQLVNVLVLLVFVEDFPNLHIALVDQLVQIGSLRLVDGICTAQR